MSHESDGAIVITLPHPSRFREPTFREALRYHCPGFIIAMWLGAIAGTLLLLALRYSLSP